MQRSSLVRMLAVLILLLATAAVAEAFDCAICGSVIEGNYFEFQAQGRNVKVCAACYQSAVKCDGCNLPIIGSAYVFNDLTFCSNCRKTRPRCALCGSPVAQRYWTYRTEQGNQIFCDSCYQREYHCAVCGLPFRGGYQLEGKFVCSHCYASLPRCGACKVPILNRSWMYPGSDAVYCDRCRQQRPRCDICSVPLGDDYYVLADQRRLCAACSAQGIFSLDAARRTYEQAQTALAKLGLQASSIPELVLTDRDHLEILARDVPGGDPDKATGLFYQRNRERLIYLISGLSKSIMLGVAAHELAHNWQCERNSSLQSALLKEGFAEWVSYHVLAANNLRTEMEKIDRRTDLYGQGFHKLREIEKKRGFAGVLKYVTQSQ